MSNLSGACFVAENLGGEPISRVKAAGVPMSHRPLTSPVRLRVCQEREGQTAGPPAPAMRVTASEAVTAAHAEAPVRKDGRHKHRLGGVYSWASTPWDRPSALPRSPHSP